MVASVVMQQLRSGLMGFDCNTQVTADQARRFFSAGYRFALRYVGRTIPLSWDISPREMDNLLQAGLGVMLVQHVEKDGPPWWSPTDDKGRAYGDGAVAQARLLKYPAGATLWLDLEGVVPGTPAEVVIRYANYWYDRVLGAGYHPGIYTGFGTQLDAEQLYRRLKFDCYWRALNLNDDEVVAHRGACMRQYAAHAPAGIPFEIDGDKIVGDALGGLPKGAMLAIEVGGG